MNIRVNKFFTVLTSTVVLLSTALITAAPAVSETSISSNRMYFSEPISGQWFGPNPSGGDPIIIDPNTFRIVPGDSIELKAKVVLHATGSPVSGRLSVSVADLAGTNDLSSAVRVETLLNGQPEITVTEQDSDKPIALNVRITFDSLATGDFGQLQAIDLGKILVKVVDDGTITQPVNPPGVPPGSVSGTEGSNTGNPSTVLPTRDISHRTPISSIPAGSPSLADSDRWSRIDLVRN
ncbi:MAG: hypothetical protein ACRCSF_03910 [Mycobacteriaceae bacterium]